MSLFSPSALGFPEAYSSLRPVQEDAIDYCLTSEKRFTGIGAPPGCGKSGIAYALAKLLGGRTVVLTGTLGLQDQYHEFTDIADIRGRANYDCTSGGTCEDGGRLGCGDKLGCPYLHAFRRQNESSIVVTSYAYWLSAGSIRPADTLICDEAGLADQWLSRSLDFHFTERELKEAGYRSAPQSDDIAAWQAAAGEVSLYAERNYEHAKEEARKARGYGRDRALQRLRYADSLRERSTRLVILSASNWVCTYETGTDNGRLWRFECVWPGQYRERLFKNVERVILLSATLRPKTLSLLGIARSDCDFKEYPRQFPLASGPVLWLPTVRLNHRTSPSDERIWLDRILSIANANTDRNGLIHTISFARAKSIAAHLSPQTRSPRQLYVNGAADPDAASARDTFDAFRKSHRGSILCSPSFGTGWDFRGALAEYQIIAKLPMPDTRSKVMQARRERDPQYPVYLAAQELVQASGRITRSTEDRGTTYIVDDSIGWFMSMARELMPAWYRIRKESEIPPPLQLLL